MARELDFTALENETEKPLAAPAERSWRSRRREANPTVQMSLRMTEDVYERFRQWCAVERRTNGDMLEEMMKSFEREQEGKGRAGR